MNIRALQSRAPHSPALEKYAEAGKLLANDPSCGPQDARDELVRILYEWTARLKIPTLGTYSVKESHVAKIVAGSRGSSMKTNPIVLTDGEIADIVRARL